jgi:hypothetical protein
MYSFDNDVNTGDKRKSASLHMTTSMDGDHRPAVSDPFIRKSVMHAYCSPHKKGRAFIARRYQQAKTITIKLLIQITYASARESF